MDKIRIQGLDLNSKFSDAVKLYGTDYSKIKVGQAEQYHWNSTNLRIDAFGEKILRITSNQVRIDGRQIVAANETPSSLLAKIGEPDHRFYGQHGEPCFSWNSGFQASFYDVQEEFKSFSDFSLTSDPSIHSDEPFANKE